MKALQGQLSSEDYDRKKHNLAVRLKRLLPGSSVSIGAILDPETGDLATASGDRARLINSHWGRVFAASPTDRAARIAWIQEFGQRFRVSLQDLRPSVADFESLLKLLPVSAPGSRRHSFPSFRRHPFPARSRSRCVCPREAGSLHGLSAS